MARLEQEWRIETARREQAYLLYDTSKISRSAKRQKLQGDGLVQAPLDGQQDSDEAPTSDQDEGEDDEQDDELPSRRQGLESLAGTAAGTEDEDEGEGTTTDGAMHDGTEGGDVEDNCDD